MTIDLKPEQQRVIDLVFRSGAHPARSSIGRLRLSADSSIWKTG